MDVPLVVSSVPEPQLIPQAGITAHTRLTARISNLTLDPKKPRFFPTASASRGNGPYGFLAQSRFFRTDSEDDIRQRWEEGKVELTRGWKKRWREAGKVRKRRGDGGAEEAGD